MVIQMSEELAGLGAAGKCKPLESEGLRGAVNHTLPILPLQANEGKLHAITPEIALLSM